MRVACYRVLYGEDFIKESIQSILPYVDRVVVAKAERPWGKSEGVLWKGEWIPWPKKFDNTRERVESIHDGRVEIVDDFWPGTANQHQHIVNDIVLDRYAADEVLFVEPDHVFSKLEADRAFNEWESDSYKQATPQMIELWRTPAWRIPRRHRASVIFQRIGQNTIGPTGGDGGVHGQPSHWLDAEVHNLGFCFSDHVMRWKHLTAIAFAEEIQDSPPDPDWLENRWMKWHPITNNKDLEISLGAAAQIPRAYSYDVEKLPADILARFRTFEWTPREPKC